MYFNEINEFIEACYYIFYSSLEVSKKLNLIDEIYKEYQQFNYYNKDFEDLYQEIKSNQYQHIVDEHFLIKNKGKILSIDDLLKQKVKIHYLEQSNAVKKIKTLDEKCLYCNAKDFFTYQGVFEKITYCKKCITYQLSDNRNDKFYINYKESKLEDFTPPNITLSNSQQTVSDQLLLLENTSALVWAVCGAGKTEIVYAVITKYLNEKKTICIAIPRKDIVRELAKRIAKDFSLKPNIIYGEEKILLGSSLYLMTTHQLIHYYNFFDLMIVDEVDAFPYNGDEVLAYTLAKSLNNKSLQIFLSATPSQKIKNAVKHLFKIPVRFHQKALPLPKIIISQHITKDLETFIKKVRDNNRKGLIFVASIKEGEALEKLTHIHFVSSKTQNRYELIEKLYQGDLDILITTTIMERGLTFPNLDVFVYKANHPYFTKQALIQITGRVGRDKNNPTGEIIFASAEKNKTMLAAIKEIDYMNQLAKHRGLIYEV